VRGMGQGAGAVLDLRLLNLRFWIDPACCVPLTAFEEPQVQTTGPALLLLPTAFCLLPTDYRVLPCK
jgi:hypothetical protein